MLFTLEALEARHGDCLLLHFGSGASHRVIVVDGGPSGVYRERLRPRLVALRDALGDSDTPLFLDAAMVSHIDDDHVEGMTQLFGELRREKDCEPGAERVVEIGALWHNAFDDLVQRVSPASLAGGASGGTVKLADAAGQVPPAALEQLAPETRLVLLSVGQGRRLCTDARYVNVPVNDGFSDGLILAPPSGKLSRVIGRTLKLTFIGPQRAQLDKLQDAWAKWVEKHVGTEPPASIAANFVDRSPYNLSSIIVLAESGGKRMLLTGDARGDHVLEGLESARLKKAGQRYHVDILKMPHHGSWRNMASTFLEQVIADHYVFSANGRDDNPDKETVEALYAARGPGAYTLHFTNDTHFATGKKLPAVTYAKRSAPKGVTVSVASRSAEIPSIVIDLGDALTV